VVGTTCPTRCRIAIAVEPNARCRCTKKALAIEFKGVWRFLLLVSCPYRTAFYCDLKTSNTIPWKVAATLAAASRCFPDQRLVLAFQPHRYCPDP
jgi:UDP-N-acetylmuramate-alanine ligase